MNHRWIQEWVTEPTAELVDRLEVGEDERDLERCRALCTGVEGVFRGAVVQQHRFWAPEATTDGIEPGLCLRSAERSIELTALCWYDFAGRRFPLRAVITLADHADELDSFTAEIGDVDPVTGAVTLVGSGAMILPERDRPGRPEAQLLVGRRPRPIVWTTVVTQLPDD